MWEQQALQFEKRVMVRVMVLALNRRCWEGEPIAVILAMQEGRECENVRGGWERIDFPEVGENLVPGRSIEKGEDGRME